MNIRPYTSFDKENDKQELHVRAVFPRDVPTEVRQISYRRLRETLGVQLVDFLDRFKSPCVVEIIEDRRFRSMGGYTSDSIVEEITMSARITNVRHTYVNMLGDSSTLWIAHWGRSKNIFRRAYEHIRNWI